MDIVSLLKNHNIEFSNDDSVINGHSRDASVFEIRPSVVVFPKNIDEISILVKNAPKNYELAVRAGGTCMSGGSLTQSVVINLTKYFKKIEIDVREHSALVEMGVLYKDLENEASRFGLLFAPYTSSKDSCGIAGMIGNNASGEKSIRYGATIDNVSKIWAILDDGVEYEFGEISEELLKAKSKENNSYGRLCKIVTELLSNQREVIDSINTTVVKRASGYLIERVFDKKTGKYNLSKLFVGSQGTLGIITKAKLKLIVTPKTERLLAIPAKNLKDLPEILKIIKIYNPEGVETFDINTFICAKTCIPEDVECASQCVGDSSLMILAQFSENDQTETDSVARKCSETLLAKNFQNQYIDDKRLFESLWNIRRSSFKAIKEVSLGTVHAVPCIEDIIVPTDRFDIFIPRLIHLLNTKDIKYGFHGHIGDGALRIIPMFDMAKPETPDNILELMREVFSLVKEMGGHMSADHSDGIIRSPFLKEFYGDRIFQVFVNLKSTIDPNNIFNPRKKTGGTVDHIKQFIIKK